MTYHNNSTPQNQQPPAAQSAQSNGNTQAPPGYHYMPDGTLMRNSDHPTNTNATASGKHEALALLIEGNKRFTENLSVNRNLLNEAYNTRSSQSPIAVILTCIDSRSSADIIFDQPIGGVFSARIAGNIVNDDILGSMEFACAASTARVIMVLGHTSCGAVNGAIDDVKLGNLTGLLDKIKPAINSVLIPRNPADRTSDNPVFVSEVTKRNVSLTIDNIINNSEVLRNLYEDGTIMIVGGVHNLSDGTIAYIG
jgi:carbonic anhydrase|tara:strand:+ start:14 stop:772 length:759 start_codon:yes stop_codon:yes gene_type:complete